MAKKQAALSQAELDALVIDEKNGGVVFGVKAHPAAKKDAITGVHDGLLKVDSTAAPEKGKANAAITKYLAAVIGVSRSGLVLECGETNQKKRFRIDAMSKTELLKRLNGNV